MNSFSITMREQNNVDILDLKGYLDAHTTPDLEKAFTQLSEKKKYRILVNCRELTYISSAGLGVFMAYIEDVRKNNGDIKLSNMTSKVYNIFDLLGFPLLYDIVKDENEAIAKFSSPSRK